MKINITMIIVCLCILSLNCGCLESSESGIVVMTMEELIEAYNLSIDNDTKVYSYLLEGFNDGDALYIRDTLNTVIYNEGYNHTLIDFKSITSPPFMIEGDITGEFSKGSAVELIVHITYANFTQQMYGDEWTVKLEIFEEGWDSENFTSIPIPQEYIRIIEDQSKVSTMTLAELMDDYERTVDNNSKKISTWFKSLNEGDTLVITDRVDNITYYEEYNITLISMKSSANSSIIPISIEGDIRNNIMVGDDIEITLHVTTVTYTQQIYDTTWIYDVETFEESWDYENNTSVPISPSFIKTI